MATKAQTLNVWAWGIGITMLLILSYVIANGFMQAAKAPPQKSPPANMPPPNTSAQAPTSAPPFVTPQPQAQNLGDLAAPSAPQTYDISPDLDISTAPRVPGDAGLQADQFDECRKVSLG